MRVVTPRSTDPKRLARPPFAMAWVFFTGFASGAAAPEPRDLGSYAAGGIVQRRYLYRGPVFYTLSASDPTAQFARETLRCLTCHDTFAEMGSVAGSLSLLDTSAYLRSTSDVVALLILEHQVTVHNEIIHANYKSRVLLERLQPGTDTATLHWSQLTPPLQSRLELMLRPLVDALLMANAASLPRPIAGSNGYCDRFQSRGPSDREVAPSTLG